MANRLRANVDNHQPSPTQQQVYCAPIVEPAIQGAVKTNNSNSPGRINAQMFNSPGVSVELAKSVMVRATQKWVHDNKKDDEGSNCSTTNCGNKRKKSWDEIVAEEYDKEQPMILANQLEWSLNMRSENKKNKKIMKNEKEKQDLFEMYLNNKNEAIRKLNFARAGESSSSEDHNCPN